MNIHKTIFLAVLLAITATTFSQDWTYVNNSGTTFILYGMSFPPGQSQVGYACGMQYTYDADGVIVKTTDGGDNWTQIWPVSGAIDGLQGIWFTSVNVGFACGWNNYFIRTTDGGATWTPVTVGTDVWYYRDVEFRDANNGIAVAVMNNTSDQAAFITSNGGTSWVPATSGLATADVMGISYASQTTVFAVGTSGNIYRSTDGGHNWSVFNTLPAMLLGVDFADANFGVIGGEEKMFATSNGGTSWSTYTTGYENFYATESFSDGTAYVGGTDENIYYTTNYGQSFSMNFNGTGTSSLYRIRFTDDGMGFACGSQGRIMKYAPPLQADFTAAPTTVCTGNTVQFTDNSTGSIDTWSWTFEGGTPATSTLPNPVVTYNTAGTYDVQLTVSSGSYNSIEIKTDYITAYSGVGQPVVPTGPAEVCGSYPYEYTTQSVQYATAYDWDVSPESAGTITGSGLVGTFQAANNWSGPFTIKVRAQSDCGYGSWSPDFSGQLYHDPVIFNLTGDGAYCEGSSGAEISLDGSETGISYELYLDNVSTGIILPGTGAPVSFGTFTETGLYTVEGYNDHCDENMVGQIYVHMLPVPGQCSTPQGPELVCSGLSVDFITSATNADEYTWELIPLDAATVTPNGSTCTIIWEENYSGTAQLTARASNECGFGPVSEELEIDIHRSPMPEVSGESLVCDQDVTEYSTPYQSGDTYSWEVTGGEITSGAGTSQITVNWGLPGTGTVMVHEVTPDGCEGDSETLQVVIDDCTGVGEVPTASVRLYPNPARDNVKMEGLHQATVHIYNLPGEEVIALKGLDGEVSIDISALPEGLYVVKVEQPDGISIFRLVRN